MSMLEGLRSIGRVPRERWISPPGIVNLPRRFRNGATVTATSAALSFDLSEATKYLAERDERLKRLIEETLPFQIDVADAQSPYEALLESIAYQSISGKAAATIYGRIKALSSNGRAPTPQEMLKLRKPVLRKAALSGAKVLATKDLAQKTIDRVLPSFDEPQTLPDQQLVHRLVSGHR